MAGCRRLAAYPGHSDIKAAVVTGPGAGFDRVTRAARTTNGCLGHGVKLLLPMSLYKGAGYRGLRTASEGL